MRTAVINRHTNETEIVLRLNLDGSGEYRIDTGIGFLDHMLELFACHGRFNLELSCKGDVNVDGHHSSEDIGIALGRAFREALGERRGICRYGFILLPMDEALVQVALDLSGRGVLRFVAPMPTTKVGDFDTELVEEFFQAFTRELGAALHVQLLSGSNSHHIIEGIFKATARALGQAVAIDLRCPDSVPSTKGTLNE